MSEPDFEALAVDWLVRATGHVPAGREQSLAVELRNAFEMGVQAERKRAGVLPYSSTPNVQSIPRDPVMCATCGENIVAPNSAIKICPECMAR